MKRIRRTRAVNASREDIPVGRENAISKKALAALWGCSIREVRATVAELRRTPSQDGFIICSSVQSTAGYWRTADPGEIREFVRHMESRARATFLAIQEARRVLKRSEVMRSEVE